MHPTSLARALALGLITGGSAAHAVSLSPNGIGQALIYPYYTVQAGQQTLLSVVNTSDVGKAAKVRFLEGYNGREVLEFTVFLSPKDIWTASVFKLSDAGLPGAGAAITTSDNTCTAPHLPEGPLPNGATYQHFLPYDYTGANSDSGPTSDARTNEGHFEVIAMADIVPGSALDNDIRHVNGVPANCARAETDFETGTGSVTPTSGLFGAASLVDVAEGTFYAYDAQALDAFTAVKLNSPTGSGNPNLASANDAGGATATARQLVAGNLVNSVYPSARAIDAVSALFAADVVYNEFLVESNGSVATDWVLTFPTKRFYVDTNDAQAQTAPFDHRFGAKEVGNGLGVSCTMVGVTLFDRNESTTAPPGCDFECPPLPPPSSVCRETNVLEFGSGALGSQLGVAISQPFSAGMLQLALDTSDAPHVLGASSNGNQWHGLPAIGFAAIKYINGAVPLSGGGSALANYTAAYPHRPTVHCIGANADGTCS